MTRISTEAYQALNEALPVMTWYKRPFESLVRTALRDQPQLLAELDFTQSKREVSNELVNRLAQDENRYRIATMQLVIDLASRSRFPDIEKLDEPERTDRLTAARQAVQALAGVSAEFAHDLREQDRVAREREEAATQAAREQQLKNDLARLRQRYEGLAQDSQPQPRGLAFESLLNELFGLFNMSPRAAYSLPNEQIDGSFSFDTDDYLLEAKWTTKPASREQFDAFAAKVGRRGRNTLGLFVSVSGFSGPAVDAYRERTPFFAMDGRDLMLVLEGRVRLDDMLRAKKRHANDTGSCFLTPDELCATIA